MDPLGSASVPIPLTPQIDVACHAIRSLGHRGAFEIMWILWYGMVWYVNVNVCRGHIRS